MKSPDSIRVFGSIVIASWLCFAAATFLPDVGRGFVKDDFSWIATARDGVAHPMHIVLPNEPGFYRPAVTASFALNYRFAEFAPRTYGLTNLALYACCVIAVVFLIGQLGLTWPSALAGAFVWAVNPHGIGMAVLWISGRTALLLTLTGTLAVIAFCRGQRLLGLALYAAALMSKEEAVVLPLIAIGLAHAIRNGPIRRIVVDGISMCGVLALYFVVRGLTPAFTIATAPWFYRPTTDLSLLLRNVAEYADRGATIGVFACLIACAVFGRRPRVGERDRRIVAAGVWWLVVAFIPTIALPVRSSLYAVFPSVGMAIVVSVVIDALGRQANLSRELAFGAALASVILFSPVYRTRNAPWVEAARVSARVTRTITHDLDGALVHGRIVLEDEPSRISNIRDAFGPLATEAIRLVTGQPLEAAVILPEQRSSDLFRDGDTIAWYKLDHGTVRRLE